MTVISAKEFWQELEGTYGSYAEFRSAIHKHYNDYISQMPPDVNLRSLLKTAHDRHWIKVEDDGAMTVNTKLVPTDQTQLHGKVDAEQGLSLRDRFMIPWVYGAIEKAIGSRGNELTEGELYEAVVTGIRTAAAEYQLQTSGRSEFPIETEGQ